MNYDLSDLLEKKSFEALNAEEHHFVLSQMTAEEFEQQQRIIRALKTTLTEEEEQMSPVFPVAALHELNHKTEKKRSPWILFAHKTPTWAAVAAGILLYFLMQQTGIGSSQNDNQPIVQETDTIFVEKFVRSEKPSVLPKDTLMAINTEEPKSNRVSGPDRSRKEEKKSPILFTDEMLNAGSINYTAFLSGSNSNQGGISLQNDSLSQLVNATVF